MPRTRETRDLLQQLQDQGFSVEKARNGHWKVQAPDGRKCQIACSPRHHRTVLNHITRLKRIGFDPKG